MSAFRGFIVQGSFHNSIEPHFDGSKFSFSEPIIPNSCQYSLKDLLASGQKVAPVETSILHDPSAIDSLMEHADSPASDSSNLDS